MHVTDGVGSIHGALRSENIPNTSCERLAKELCPGNSDYLSYDTEISEKACEWIESVDSSSNSTPWVLFISFISPHYPLIAPPEYYEMYPLHDVPLPKSMSVNDPKHHPLIREIRKGWPYDDYMNEEKRRMGIAAYFGMCSFMDANVGKILTSLNKSQLTQNTQIIYMSDHGEALCDHGLLLKGCRFFEGLTRVPLMISWPEKYCKDLVSDALVELVDLAPTLLDAAGLPTPYWVQGRSLTGVLEGKTDTHRDFVRTEFFGAINYPDHTHATMYRDRKWKLMSYHGKDLFELYDLEQDPHEGNNLANSSEHAETLSKLKKKLKLFQQRTNDPWIMKWRYE